MDLAWWGWLLVAVWCLPGVYAAFAVLLQKPISGLDENDEPYKPIPLLRKLVFFPVVLVLLVIVWPWVFWSEGKHSSR